MARRYHIITREERDVIERRYNSGDPVTDIASSLGVHRASIYVELHRGLDARGRYHATTAQSKVNAFGGTGLDHDEVLVIDDLVDGVGGDTIARSTRTRRGNSTAANGSALESLICVTIRLILWRSSRTTPRARIATDTACGTRSIGC